MVYYFTPYSINKDLGRAYNQYVDIVPNDDDWICLVDADSCFLTPDFGHTIQDIIDKYPDTGLFTTYTNRVGNLEQCYQNYISPDPNVLNHRKIAQDLVVKNKDKVKEINKIISGMIMIFKKSTWKEVGKFPEDKGILAIDNRFSKRILLSGKKIRLIESIYLFHFYRMDTGIKNKKHLL